MRLKDAEAQVQELKASALATARENVIKAITTVPPANGTATPGLHPSSSSSGSLSVPRITTTASTTGAGGDLGHGGSELALPSAGGTSPRLVAAPDLPPPSPTGLAAALLPPRPPPARILHQDSSADRRNNEHLPGAHRRAGAHPSRPNQHPRTSQPGGGGGPDSRAARLALLPLRFG
ncbi:hypothetical protein DFJ73DRAFT_175161 [Zopfochytrium polystomum]|nr:hypothetical protein DFJ73DRAFT_175161 [Zopfochytrium polystomum]